MTLDLKELGLLAIDRISRADPRTVRWTWVGTAEEIIGNWHKDLAPYPGLCKDLWNLHRGDPDTMYISSSYLPEITEFYRPYAIVEPVNRNFRISRIINPVTGTEIEVCFLDCMARGTMFLVKVRGNGVCPIGRLDTNPPQAGVLLIRPHAAYLGTALESTMGTPQ